MNLNIYEYHRPSDYIKALYAQVKGNRATYSMRSFAQDLGLSTHTTLHRIMTGERKLSKQYIKVVAQYLKLNSDEMNYLVLMNGRDGIKSPEEKIEYSTKMKLLAQKGKAEFSIVDDFEIQKNPLSYILMELVDIAPLKYDVKMIQKRLCHPFQLEEIESMLKLLLNKNFLYLGLDNYLVAGSEQYLYSHQDRKNLAIQSYHKILCQLAATSVETQSVDEREFNAISINIDPEKIAEIKQYLRDAQKDFIARFNEPTVIGAKTYQLNSQLFKVAQ